MTGIPVLVVISALMLSLTFQSLRVGQIVPIVLMLLVLGAALLERGRYWSAAALLGAAMIEPNVTLPALAGVFVAAPRMRLPLACAAGVLALLSLLALGLGQNIIYFRDVLPAHIAAELPMNTYQFSLTNLLHQLGVADAVALLLGKASYLIMSAIGVVLGVVLARRRGHPALSVFCPCAIALIGGPYVHLVQLVCAIPLALFLLAKPAQTPGIAVATLLLASPWLELTRNSGTAEVLVFVALASAPIAWYASRGNRVRALALTLAMLLVGTALSVISLQIQHHRPDNQAVPPQARAANLPADASWSAYTRRVLDLHNGLLIAEKLPTWAGLLILLAGATVRTSAPRENSA
jgi:hypothetical protein